MKKEGKEGRKKEVVAGCARPNFAKHQVSEPVLSCVRVCVCVCLGCWRVSGSQQEARWFSSRLVDVMASRTAPHLDLHCELVCWCVGVLVCWCAWDLGVRNVEPMPASNACKQKRSKRRRKTKKEKVLFFFFFFNGEKNWTGGAAPPLFFWV